MKTRTLKKVLAAVLTASMCLSPLAVSASEGDSSSVTGRMTEDGRTKVIVGTTNNTGSLDPMLSDQANNRLDMMFLMYENLVYEDSDGVYYPCLAKSWEMTSNNTCEVVLHDNIYDIEGNHITADDICYCFELCQEAGINTITDIDTCEKIDDYTILFTAKDEDPAMGAMESALTGIWVVSQAAYEASEDQMAAHPVGTGAYILTDFQSGSSLTLEKNENYWNKDGDDISPSAYQNVDVIEFQIIGDKSQVAIALQTGTIDISDCLAAADAVYFEEGGDYADDFVIENMAKNLALWICYNCSESSPFNNINLRKAVAYCFDTPSLIVGAESGYGEEIKSFFCNYSNYYNDAWDDEEYYEYDQAVAQEYLDAFTEETGIAVSDLNIHILANSNNSAPCELLGAYLSILGIPYTLDMLDQAVVTTTQTDETAWDIFVNERSTFGDEMKKTWDWFSVTAQSYGNIQFIEDDTLEQLAYDATHVSTVTQDTVDALHEYVADQCYIIGLYQREKNEVYANWISDIQHTKQLNIAINACTFNF